MAEGNKKNEVVAEILKDFDIKIVNKNQLRIRGAKSGKEIAHIVKHKKELLKALK
jgi:hypothetical protein